MIVQKRKDGIPADLGILLMLQFAMQKSTDEITPFKEYYKNPITFQGSTNSCLLFEPHPYREDRSLQASLERF
jgi:hypothetical protein